MFIHWRQKILVVLINRAHSPMYKVTGHAVDKANERFKYDKVTGKILKSRSAPKAPNKSTVAQETEVQQLMTLNHSLSFSLTHYPSGCHVVSLSLTTVLRRTSSEPKPKGTERLAVTEFNFLMVRHPLLVCRCIYKRFSCFQFRHSCSYEQYLLTPLLLACEIRLFFWSSTCEGRCSMSNRDGLQ
jgi:hypothetical protein